jgi:hypothetical protein
MHLSALSVENLGCHLPTYCIIEKDLFSDSKDLCQLNTATKAPRIIFCQSDTTEYMQSKLQ